MGQQEKYLEEYEKYKHIVITLGQYVHKESKTIYIITNINLQENYVEIKTIKSGFTRTRTLHWCRKYLEKCVESI